MTNLSFFKFVYSCYSMTVKCQNDDEEKFCIYPKKEDESSFDTYLNHFDKSFGCMKFK